MGTRLISNERLNKIFNSDLVLSPDGWGEISKKLEELGNEELREFRNSGNNVIRYLTTKILFDRKAIRL